MTTASWIADVETLLRSRGCTVTRDGELGARTTYRVGGRAAVLVEIADAAATGGLGEAIDDRIPVIVVGNGSNLLVSDAGFDGIAIVVTHPEAETNEIEAVPSADGNSCDITARGALRLPVLARQTVAAGWCGLEWAVGVPGSVGGAVRMNAGGHGSDVSKSIVRATILNLRTNRELAVDANDLGLRFRGSALSDDHLVIDATFRVHSPRGHDCASELSSIVAWRREHQPGGQNAGSVFVNPGDGPQSAGALIDAAGLRGRRLRSAEVSTKHANFIQVDVGGSADDVAALMVEVQSHVQKSTGITMRSEIRLLGFSEDIEERFRDPHRDDAEVRAAEARLRSLV